MPNETIEYAKRCRKIADEQGFAFWVALAIAEEGIGFKYLGRFKESVEAIRTALAQLEATGSFIIFPKYRSHLAESLWQSGQRDAAKQQLDQAFTDQFQGEYMMHAELLRVRGDFARDSGDLDAAESSYRESIAVAQQQGTKMNELRATLHLARLDQSRGNSAAARERLEPLYNWFTEGFDMPDLKAAKSLLESL